MIYSLFARFKMRSPKIFLVLFLALIFQQVTIAQCACRPKTTVPQVHCSKGAFPDVECSQTFAASNQFLDATATVYSQNQSFTSVYGPNDEICNILNDALPGDWQINDGIISYQGTAPVSVIEFTHSTDEFLVTLMSCGQAFCSEGIVELNTDIGNNCGDIVLTGDICTGDICTGGCPGLPFVAVRVN
jgi:hypothetical protein